MDDFAETTNAIMMLLQEREVNTYDALRIMAHIVCSLGESSGLDQLGTVELITQSMREIEVMQGRRLQ